ncbi:MAG: DUF305 domain-containing protein [Sciscionella sp.]
MGFAQDMSTHHLQAVQMANWERDHIDDPKLQQLAFDLEQTQLEQVGRIKGWLSIWGEPEQGSGADQMSWMTHHARHDGMSGMGSGSMVSSGLMPGMATQAELAQLRSLSGGRRDVRFLQLMLRRHQGGIPMAEYAVRHACAELSGECSGHVCQVELPSVRGASVTRTTRDSVPWSPSARPAASRG